MKGKSMAKVTDKKIVGLTVKYSDGSTASYDLTKAESLSEESKRKNSKGAINRAC